MPESNYKRLQAGEMVAGRYQIIEPLGEGGMGAVYVAVQHPLGRKVALKVLRPPNPDDSAHVQERFLREARAAARLSHPNVVTVHDFGIDEVGRSFLVMEWVQGDTLRTRLKAQAPFPWRQALNITADIARALRAAHEHGIVHRDLKPENVIWDQNDGEERARVLDFGLAKLHDDIEDNEAGTGSAKQTLTQEGIFLGTPGYAAPEFATHGVSDDPRLDLYGLGVMLFEMLTGRAPFQGKTALSVMMAHVQNPVPLPTAVGPQRDIPKAVDALVLRLMEKDPENRPCSAKALLDEIQHILEGATEERSALGAEFATEASESLSEQLREAVAAAPAALADGERPSTPATGSYRLPAENASQAAIASLAQVTAEVPRVAARAQQGPVFSASAKRWVPILALLFVVAGALWGWQTKDLANACLNGAADACMQEGARLIHASPPDAPAAFRMFEKACELGQSQGCEKRDGPWPGGVLRRGFLGERGVISPYEMRTGIGPRIARHVMEPFVRQDKEGRISPAALASWELDATGMKLRLQPHANKKFRAHPRCFPQGKQAQLEDYRFSVELAVRNWPPFDLPIRGREDFVRHRTQSLAGLQIEHGSLVIEFENPVGQVDRALSQVWLVPVLTNDCDNPSDWRHPVGTGDFEFVESGTGGWTSLKRVFQDASGVPHIEGIEYVPVGDAGEAMAWISAGRLEIVEMSSLEGENLLHEDAPLRLKGAPAEVAVGQSVLTGMVSLTLLELNARRVPLFREPDTRLAIHETFDTKALPVEEGGALANGRYLPAWALGFSARAGKGERKKLTASGREEVLQRLRDSLPDGSSLKLGYAEGLKEVASTLTEQLAAARIQVVGVPIARGERINIGESFDLYLERIRYRAKGRDVGGFLTVLPIIFRHFGHALPSVDLLTEMLTSQRQGTEREMSTADVEWEIMQSTPAIPLLFGPKSERDKLFLFSPRVGGFVDDATKRVVRSERNLWLLPATTTR